MSHHPHMVVGFDGTQESEHAVAWAADEAQRRRMALTVCHAWRWPYPISHIDYEGVAIVKRMAGHLLHRGAVLAAEQAPRLTIREKLADGPASSALLHEAGDAEMIVIGSHEHSGLPVGSSTLQVPARAQCPVVVVREPEGPTEGRVVVGVDGSSAADAALAFAFEEAALRGWTVHAVYGCWEPAAVADTEIGLYVEEEQLRRVCGTRLQCAVAPWRERYPHVEATTTLRVDDPRTALLEAAPGADLIVVGALGTRVPHPQKLGATTLAMLQLAACSVAVVHANPPS